MDKTETIEQLAGSRNVFGFWVYLMTDCVLFASLFAVYIVLHKNTFGGPSAAQIFNLPYVLVETLILLTSSLTCGLASLVVRSNKQLAVLLFGVTFVLGIMFLVLEIGDFHSLVVAGNSWRRSGFLSSYFVLVATHGLHITIGLIWMAVTTIQLIRRNVTNNLAKQLTMVTMFWHFLDIIWIFIFTIVYLFGAMSL